VVVQCTQHYAVVFSVLTLALYRAFQKPKKKRCTKKAAVPAEGESRRSTRLQGKPRANLMEHSEDVSDGSSDDSDQESYESDHDAGNKTVSSLCSICI
jgi:hypothetical protein